jgi:mRNA (guanine-N7-)-methyltransferase
LKSITGILFEQSLPLPDPQIVNTVWKAQPVPLLQLDTNDYISPPSSSSRTRNRHHNDLGPAPPYYSNEPAASSENKSEVAAPPYYSNESSTASNKRIHLDSGHHASNTTATTATDEAENFYNNLGRNREDRTKSYIYHLRCLNNFVKSSLLHKYLRHFGNHHSNSARILELSCGKGADVFKMKKSTRHISRYVGTDIAKNSLDEAILRFQGNSNADNNLAMKMNMLLISADLSQCDLTYSNFGIPNGQAVQVWDYKTGKWMEKSDDILPQKETFNFLSMQFAFHYMFSQLVTIERFFHGVSNRMDLNAYFVVTTVSADALISHLMNTSEKKIVLKDEKDRITCEIEFDSASLERLLNKRDQDIEEDWMGIQYRFRLFDEDTTQAVDAPEWLVPNSTLKKMAEKYQLKIVEQCRLTDFALNELYNNNAGEDLWKRMNVSNQQGTLSDIEWKIASLYQVIVFQKIQPASAQAQAQVVEEPEDAAASIMALIRLSKQVPGWDNLTDDEKTALVRKEVKGA